MQVVPSGSPLTFEYGAYDESGTLFVAMKVYDVTGTPGLVATTPMTHIFGGSYVASFTPVAAKQYLIHKAVYTDGSYTALDPLRSPGTETFLASSAAGGSLTPSDLNNIATAVWDEPQTSHVTTGTFGFNLDVPVSSRSDGAATSDIQTKVTNINANTAPSVIAQDVWNAARSSFTVSGTFGEALQGVLSTARAALLDNLDLLDVMVSSRAQQSTADAISADTTYLHTNLTSGRIANLDKLDATVSSRATQTSVNSLPTAAGISIAVWNEPLSSHTGAGTTGLQLGSIPTTAAPTVGAIADAVWDEAGSGHTTAGTFGARLDVVVSSRSSDSDMQLIKGAGFTTGDDLHSLKAKVNTLPTTAGDATAANQATILASVNSRASQTSITTLQSAVAAIPTNPVLTTDARIARLDATVSSRASEASLDDAKGSGFTVGTDDLHSIKQAVGASVDLSPVLAQLTQIEGAGFSSTTDSLHAAAAAAAAATAAANAAAAAATAANAAVASKASQGSVTALQTSVSAIPTNPVLATDARLSHLDANVSSRADAVTLGQLMGPSFNPATDSVQAIRILVSALAPGDASLANQVAILNAIATLATASGLNTVAAAVAAIPINPVLANDVRLGRLDVAVSTRATDADMQLVKGSGFVTSLDSLHAIKQAVPAPLDISTVLAELAKIEGAGFTPSVDDLKSANDTAKAERAQIYANTESLLSSGEPF